VSGGNNNTVNRFRRDGSNAGAFPVGAGSEGVAFDGMNIWVANYESGTVTKLRASDGTVLGTFNVPSPSQIAFDGKGIWVATPDTGVVYLLRPSDGVQIGVFGAAVSPAGIAFDGANMWVAASGSNIVYKF
jgi:sugar lactone lactonase YvrE